MSSKRGLGSQKEKSWEEELQWWPSFCCTPITTEGSIAHSEQLQKGHYGSDFWIWTWGSRVVRCNLRVNMIKPSGVH